MDIGRSFVVVLMLVFIFGISNGKHRNSRTRAKTFMDIPIKSIHSEETTTTQTTKLNNSFITIGLEIDNTTGSRNQTQTIETYGKIGNRYLQYDIGSNAYLTARMCWASWFQLGLCTKRRVVRRRLDKKYDCKGRDDRWMLLDRYESSDDETV
ncbi:hypothetical protein CHUAL_009490 [Chamberlinius hualienensis]